MGKLLDILRKLVPGQSKGRRIVKVHNERVDIGEAAVADRRRDLGRPLGIVLLVVALSIYVGIFDLVGLSVPIVIGHLALAFGLLFAREWLLKIVKWGKVTVSLNAKAKGEAGMKRRVIRAEEEKKKPQAEE